MAHAIFDAIENGNLAEVKKQLTTDPGAALSHDDKSGFGGTPLHAAVNLGFYDIAEELINPTISGATKANINAQDNFGKAPIIALLNNYQGQNPENLPKILGLLLENGAELDINTLGNLKQSADELFKDVKWMGTISDADKTKRKEDSKKEINGKIAEHIFRLIDHISTREPELKAITEPEYINAVNEADADKKTPLLHAIDKSNEKSINILLNNGAEINTKDNKGNTAVMYAAEKTEKILNIILAKNPNIDEKNNDDKTALYIAVENKKYKISQKLIDAGANTDIKCGPNEETALICASKNNLNSALIKRIISKSTDLAITDKNGLSAIHYAIDNDNKDITKEIITKGIDPNTATFPKTNSREEMPLLAYAVIQGKKDIVEVLLENGANPNIEIPGTKRTVLTKATEDNNNQIVELLLLAGADLHAKDKDGKKASDYAAGTPTKNLTDGANRIAQGIFTEIDKDKPEDIKTFIDGAKWTLNTEQDSPGKHTTLTYALANNKLNAYLKLLEMGADVNKKNKDENTPLMEAVKTGNEKTVEETLKYNPNIDEKNNAGNTALILAISPAKSPAIVEMLLRAGADITIENNASLTAKDIADTLPDGPVKTQILDLLKEADELANSGLNTDVTVSETSPTPPDPNAEKDKDWAKRVFNNLGPYKGNETLYSQVLTKENKTRYEFGDLKHSWLNQDENIVNFDKTSKSTDDNLKPSSKIWKEKNSKKIFVEHENGKNGVTKPELTAIIMTEAESHPKGFNLNLENPSEGTIINALQIIDEAENTNFAAINARIQELEDDYKALDPTIWGQFKKNIKGITGGNWGTAALTLKNALANLFKDMADKIKNNGQDSEPDKKARIKILEQKINSFQYDIDKASKIQGKVKALKLDGKYYSIAKLRRIADKMITQRKNEAENVEVKNTNEYIKNNIDDLVKKITDRNGQNPKKLKQQIENLLNSHTETLEYDLDLIAGFNIADEIAAGRRSDDETYELREAYDKLLRKDIYKSIAKSLMGNASKEDLKDRMKKLYGRLNDTELQNIIDKEFNDSQNVR